MASISLVPARRFGQAIVGEKYALFSVLRRDERRKIGTQSRPKSLAAASLP